MWKADLISKMYFYSTVLMLKFSTYLFVENIYIYHLT